jgi:photosystem II stability/assembly factor-like uncharacterized protein
MAKLFFAVEDALAVLTVSADGCHCDFALSGRRPQCVAVDPLRRELAYCGTLNDGLWRSENGGNSWSPAGPGIRHARVLSVAASGSQRAGDRGVAYAGTEPSALFRSDDGGATWRACPGLTSLPSAGIWSFPPRPATHHVRWIASDPHRQDRLFAAIEAGALVHSPDGGATWRDRTPDGPRDTHQLALHHSDPDRLYSAAGDGYFESRDGGETWQRLEEGLRHAYAWSVAVDRDDPDNVILSSAASPQRSHGQPAESFIYRRQGGAPWQMLQSGLPSPSGRRTAVLAAHPQRARTFFAVWEDEAFRSSDGGERWTMLETPDLHGRPFNELCALVVVDE